MKPKIICKIIIDFVMTVLMLILMAYHLIGDVLHEWVGAVIFILFIAHNILNIRWYQNLFRRKYTAFQVLQTTINILIFGAMIGLMISGIMLSHHVFSFLSIRKGMLFARKLHMLSAYWGFLLISLHLGIHWEMIMGIVRKATKTTSSPRNTTMVLRTTGILIAAYGLYAFVKREMGSNMFLKNQFVFGNLDEPIVMFLVDYLAIIGLCVFVANYTVKFIKKHC